MSTRDDQPPPYSLVVFDCDSTLSSIEGIEELAAGGSPELTRLTERAMSGELPLEEVYAKRLELVRPTRDDVERIGRRYVETVLPNAQELVAALTSLGKRVVVLSGGLLPPVRTLASHLGIPSADVHAVDIFFDEAGHYAGFERDSPLARSGGKPDVLRDLTQGETAAVLVGDGATDLEAAPVVQRFVAFGGVVRRPTVFAGAQVHVEAADFAALLPLLADADELARLGTLPEHRLLLDAARALL